MNIYGREKYFAYRKSWEKWYGITENTEWIWAGDERRHVGDYLAVYKAYAAKGLREECSKYTLAVYRLNKLVYTCEDIYSDAGTFFYFFFRGGEAFLMFRKDDLYGYTILNLDRAEEYNYFPDIERAGESFIIVDAQLWGDILLLDGCFWGAPYIRYLLDLKTHKTHRLTERGVGEYGAVIEDGVLTLHFAEGEPKTERFSYRDLEKLLEKSRTCDLDL